MRRAIAVMLVLGAAGTAAAQKDAGATMHARGASLSRTARAMVKGPTWPKCRWAESSLVAHGVGSFLSAS